VREDRAAQTSNPGIGGCLHVDAGEGGGRAIALVHDSTHVDDAARVRLGLHLRAIRCGAEPWRRPRRTQRTVGRKAGLDERYVGRVENGLHDGGIRALVAIARALDVTSAVLADAYIGIQPGNDGPATERFRQEAEGGAAALGIALRRLRVEQGLTIAEAAVRGRVAASYIGLVERGAVASPGLGVLLRITACSTTNDDQLRTEFRLALRTYAGEAKPPFDSYVQVGRRKRT